MILLVVKEIKGWWNLLEVRKRYGRVFVVFINVVLWRNLIFLI